MRCWSWALTYPPAKDGSSASEVNHLVGGMSPYGPDGAANLLSSVSQVGAAYYDDLIAAAGAGATCQP